MAGGNYCVHMFHYQRFVTSIGVHVYPHTHCPHLLVGVCVVCMRSLVCDSVAVGGLCLCVRVCMQCVYSYIFYVH